MADRITIFMCGDVMTGRGIDQVLPYPNTPHIYEPYMRSAMRYVMLAEGVSGPVPKPVDFPYIWGDALDELERARPDLRIINLETAVTKSEEYEDKGINYRMHPDNIRCIKAAGIDCCSLANNHILDWGYPGLIETLETLKSAGIQCCGAGRNLREAESPAVMEVSGRGRVIVFSFGSETSGIPRSWAAAEDRAGVNFLKDLTIRTAQHIAEGIRAVRQRGDIVIASIHWGSNWGYEIPDDQIKFAHALIDSAGVDVIHGHSSHHVKGIEVYKGKLILYGCGDFLNDYEGISGYENFRGDLALMYFASIDALSGDITSLKMAPTQIRHFRVNRASEKDAIWLRDILNREGGRLGTAVGLNSEKSLLLKWDNSSNGTNNRSNLTFSAGALHCE